MKKGSSKIGRIFLFAIHILILAYTYLRFIYDKIVRSTVGKLIITENSFNHFKKIPSHVGIVFNSDKVNQYAGQIQEVVDLASTISGINEISLFFTKDIPELKIMSDKVTIYSQESVQKCFLAEMNKKSAIESNLDPFRSPLDVVIFYCRVHSLCNFFPWRLDLCTLVYPGDIKICSKYSFYHSIVEFQKTEQRCGK